MVGFRFKCSWVDGWQEAAETLEKQGLKEDAIQFYLRVRRPQGYIRTTPPSMHAYQAAATQRFKRHVCWCMGLCLATDCLQIEGAALNGLAPQAAELYAGEEQSSEANKCRLKVLITQHVIGGCQLSVQVVPAVSTLHAPYHYVAWHDARRTFLHCIVD